MPDVQLPFTRFEYQDRLEKVRAAMDAANIDVLFACDPSNMAWLTGYDGWSFYVHQGVIVGPEGDPVFWGRKMDAAGALRTCYMDAEDIVGYSDDYVMSADRHAMQHLADILRERGWAAKRIGVEMENYYYSARAHTVLVSQLGREPADATGLINWQRAVKSDTEIVYMRRAARIVERMHNRILEIMEPGKRRNEIAAEIYKTGIWGAEENGVSFGGDYPAIAPLMPTGLDATAAHLTWDDRPFETGAATFFEIAGCYRRYHAPLCRTIHLGEPPDDMRRAEEAVLEGIEAGVNAARPGNTAGDVAAAFYAVLERRGVEREGRCGYPIGMSYPPDWGERTFSIRPTDTTVLEPDMTFHFMPALWMKDWGLEITEPLRIRDEGPAEFLADYPRQLFVKK
ncbi:MAG: M24 family metallopeptidase [Minwuia sp.]|uniref:M24 family metallopeptidase n=1 Tax=Minwuia sp. TaxID=2493630 RepID=UPI003A8A0A90